ncbi:NAD-dependent epimerase/dehydratase family protein [Shewanella sp. 1_MG-2023]|uniref:NAD-dependent epimerase/dehydratase family protein n=1 Tax=unclassified Shewanella TaxID=196818 RepID=UPI0026E40EC1|nr:MULTISPECIES: NAD-dependent epimerase/dehydratase family protein [unclassified Shewanella]MDO6610118.1 NAD-dependent epimerase/dehydratase family protein [Shewanella sp. 7_MG-2023]MDO6769740.1 NAD-dependent epimerase/dehydratase family protein [Shewanella sp. 2_MG-2023]MDO6792804.1 NAD-dependent epimerase/dehydratase family protein [Shewanella sp. 1_MG-2023]
MSTLLTGATGFIGSRLLRLGDDFKVVIRNNELLPLRSPFIINQLDSTTSWDKAFIGVTKVIHLAGLAHSNAFSNIDYQRINVDGTLCLAKAAAEAGVSRFVFVSSIGVNGTYTKGISFSENTPPVPHNDYAKSKYDAENGLKKIAEDSGMELVIVRPTLVYGANAPGNFGSLTKLVNKSPILPFGLTNNRRDFISVHNLADLLITCANHPNAAGHTFLASDGVTVSIKEFTNAIAKGLGTKVVQLPVPVCLMRLVGRILGKSQMVEQLVGDLQVDSSNLKKVLDWTPPHTMEESMALLNKNN